MSGCQKLCTVTFHGGNRGARCGAPIWKGTLCRNCYPGSRQELEEDQGELLAVLEELIAAAPASGPLWHGSEQMIKAWMLVAKTREKGD